MTAPSQAKPHTADTMSTTETAEPTTQQRPKAERIALDNMIFESVLFLNNAESVQGFSQQFEALGNQARRLQAIEQRIQVALTTAEKDALAKVREQEVRDLQAKDALFQKVYGVTSLLSTRPFRIFPTKLQVLVPVTDEELTKARAEKDFKEEGVVVRDNSKLLLACTMTGAAIQGFERDIKVFHANRENAILTKAQAERLTGEEKTKAEAAFAEAEKALTEEHARLTKTYGLSPMRPFRAEALSAVLFVALTKEEVERAAAQQQAEAAEAPKAESKKEKAAKAN